MRNVGLILSIVITLVCGTVDSTRGGVIANEKQEINLDMSALQKLSFEDVLNDRNIIDALYVMKSTEDISLGGHEIILELYIVNKDVLIYYENIPKSIVVIRSGNNVTRLPITSYRPISKIIHDVPKTEKPVFLIRNLSGGNCWNCNQYYVVSLEDKYFLKNIGEASSWKDVDNDGFEELIKYDDIWEIGLGYLSHADSPGVEIILAINDGKVAPDVSGHMNYYQAEIERLNNEIEKYPREIPTDFNARLLSRILHKFLIYRLLGDMEEGWREFNQDIKHYDKDFFYLCIICDEQRKADKISIDEIVGKMKESLERN